jgi:hypothetical protein
MEANRIQQPRAFPQADFSTALLPCGVMVRQSSSAERGLGFTVFALRAKCCIQWDNARWEQG